MDVDKRTAQQLTNSVTDLRRSVDELVKTLKAAQKPRAQITNVYGEKVKYDEDTMMKVFKALRTPLRVDDTGTTYELTADMAQALISEMQNQGILFRERG